MLSARPKQHAIYVMQFDPSTFALKMERSNDVVVKLSALSQRTAFELLTFDADPEDEIAIQTGPLVERQPHPYLNGAGKLKSKDDYEAAYEFAFDELLKFGAFFGQASKNKALLGIADASLLQINMHVDLMEECSAVAKARHDKRWRNMLASSKKSRELLGCLTPRKQPMRDRLEAARSRL